ncbi:MAG: amino acid racemase [Bacillota bacterium]|nr:amino acid racemase [Bacillota bacterium]
MNNNKSIKKTVGIIGGMGPEATSDLFEKIINFTDANSDQEHIHLVIDNNTDINDRSHYILNKENSPEKELIKTAQKLEKYGVDFIAMPCNTAHYFYEKIQLAVGIPILNMIKETATYLKENKKDLNFTLLATEGTYTSDIYKKEFEKFGLNIIYPKKEHKNILMEAIYNFKKSKPVDIEKLNNVIDKMNMEKQSLFVLGCTELPLIFKKYSIKYDFIDTTEILAKSIIKRANYNLK